MKINKSYNFIINEKKLYNKWYNSNLFTCKYNIKKKNFTVILPPPNITGDLHIGHIMNITIQDMLVRYSKLFDYNVCFIPGIDHASIATENKVLKYLKKKYNIDKKCINKINFINHVNKWVNKYSKIIINQIKILGCACDWNKFKFTMNNKINDIVTKYFIKLYNNKLIYRENSIVNWDIKLKTSLSNEEVFYKKKKNILYYIKYKILNSNNYAIVSTTRPETIFADVAICINPNDKKNKHIMGKYVIVPIINKVIPVITDKSIDINFGTGCNKITPAHSMFDKIISDKYKLKPINILNKNGTLNKKCDIFNGMNIIKARKLIVKHLKNNKYLLKNEYIISNIAYSERNRETIIEQKLSKQWFLNIKKIIKIINKDLLNVNLNINFIPKKIKKLYNSWIKNINNWNISRQLWWGHRIPVFYYGKNKKKKIVSQNKYTAFKYINSINKNKFININDIKQDKYVLDTWFSSCIWPLLLFNNNKDKINYYLPSTLLVTGKDILFFWVIRMILLCLFFTKKQVFKNILLTGIIKDKNKIKMSKSLGNYPNTNFLFNKYGSDVIRISLLFSFKLYNDINYNENIFLKGKKFINKLWNIFRFINLLKSNNKVNISTLSYINMIWFNNLLLKYKYKIYKLYNNYEVSKIVEILDKLVNFYFSNWYIEIIKKNVVNNNINNILFNKTILFFKIIIKFLNPCIPFITQIIWNNIKSKKDNNQLFNEKFSIPINNNINKYLLKDFDELIYIVKKIRNFFIKIKNINIIIFIFFKKGINIFLIKILKSFFKINKIILLNGLILYNRISDIILTNNIILYIKINNSKSKKKTFTNNLLFVLYKKMFLYTKTLYKLNKKLYNINFFKNAPNKIVNIEIIKKKNIKKKIIFFNKYITKIYKENI